MLDLGGEYQLCADEIRAAIEAVLESRQFIGGPAVIELEKALSSRVGVEHAVAVSSGTDALLCTMMGLDIGHGDEVILPAFTFFATAGSVARLGAKPVFVDIDPRTFNVDPDKIEAAITDRTRAIIAVHLFGQCAEMNAINAIATRHHLTVIEDAAQAIGAAYHGRPAGALGDVACVSFYPTKNLGGFGEGGMIFTSDEHLAGIARQLRNHGESQRYVHERVGGNFRLDTMKAAILLVRLRYLDQFTKRRRDNAARYNALLEEVPVTTPYVPAHQTEVYHQYSILCDRRDELRSFLQKRGVHSAVYYPVPLHLQKCFAFVGCRRGSLPVTEQLCDRILSLPCHPMLTEADLQYVASGVQEFYARFAPTCATASDTHGATEPRSANVGKE
ncbi:MAG: DegT/DnrJ/EryC1/StrS family aminotransferase [Phycisphaerales bacterium]|nr:MAG: DegT/DnrJ/EryC1/StrS family aminotransferase [Phycisphaerales bacterium]